MTSFNDIPYSDIVKLLIGNGQDVPINKNDAYDKAWNLISTNQLSYIPESIIDFIIAYRLAEETIYITKYRASDILYAPSSDLVDLSNSLGLTTVNKERILRILKYLNGLDNDMSVYDTLPNEILLKIAMKLDCKSLIGFCEISDRFKDFCSEGELEKIFREKLKSLTKLNVTKYNSKQLELVCQVSKLRHLSLNSTDGEDNEFKIFGLILNNKGKCYAFGSNEHQNLGIPIDNNIFIDVPRLIPYLDNLIQVLAGERNSFLLNNKGEVYAMGIDSLSEIEQNTLPFDDPQRVMPRLIPTLKNIIQLAYGRNSNKHEFPSGINERIFALNDQGYVHYFGWGSGNPNIDNIVKLLPDVNNIIKISSSFMHLLALNNNGQVYGFGFNNYGQLGLGYISFEEINPSIIPGLNNIIDISAGNVHSLVVDDKGNVYGFGSDKEGILGLGIDTPEPLVLEVDKLLPLSQSGIEDLVLENIITVPTLIPKLKDMIQVSAGETHSLALSNSGHVYSFGDNYFGESGLPAVENVLPTLIPNLNNIIEVCAGTHHSLVLNNQGQIYTFGYNSGTLAHSDRSDSYIPLLIPKFNINS